MLTFSVDPATALRADPLCQKYQAFDVVIAGIGTAVPDYELDQAEITARARSVFPHLARLDRLYANTGIERRYSCRPTEWYYHPHGWEDRTAAFQEDALPLLEVTARRAIDDAGVTPADIDAIVVNTITGLAIPSLDAALSLRLGLRNTIERLPIFGFGCGGGVAGLARAARLAQTIRGGHVLFLTIDLCTLCLRMNDQSLAMFVSGALFGDGAAAIVLRNDAGARESGGSRIVAMGEHLWPDTAHILGLDVMEDGFAAVLSPELPAMLRASLGPALSAFLERAGLHLSDLDGFLLHPGGRKVVETAKETLNLSDADLRHSWSVLRDFGNMSSATVLFVLQRALAERDRGRHLLAAFGPGFSAYFMVLDL